MVGKNYRVQNIQLSKIRWGQTPKPPGAIARAASVNVGCGRLATICSALSLPDVGGRETRKPHSLTETFQRPSPPPRFALRWATFAYIHERRLVENTGLEPVTSWLQTRRSPS